MTTEEEDAWADALAATLDPMSPAECAAVGRLAATLDARRASARKQSATTPPAAKAPARRVA